MSKQDIEKRLGFAAQGVKETTRTSAKAEMGFLSRVGYAATALTADPADPKSAEYRKQVSEAKAAAKDAITNYKFMRDKVKERLAALDAYVTNAIKVINSATSAKDIEHYVEQLRIAVKSQSMILGASKSPFSRPGAKAKFGRFSTEFGFLANQIKNQPDLAKKNIIVLAKKMGNESDITGPEFEQLVQYAEKLGMSSQVINAYDSVHPGFSRSGVKAKMAKRMVVDTITSGNQKHELGYESVMQPVAAGEPPHEWFRPIVRTTNLDTGKSSEKASQPHYTEKSARDWLKNYASSVKPSTDPLYAEYASNREKISKMMTRLAQARNNPELRQKLQTESDKLDARQREVAAQLQKRKSSRTGAKAAFAASDIIVKKDAQYIYYYPEDDDRATFPDDNGKGAYTVKSNRTGKPVSAKTYRSFQEAAAASNEMNEKLPPLKKAKASRPGAKAKA